MPMVLFFLFFSLKIKYGWTIRNIWICRIKSNVYRWGKKGKLIKTDTFFDDLYDFWTSYHDPCKIIPFSWYCPKIRKLENNIRRKWKSKDLPNVNIILQKYGEKDDFLNPERFLEEFDQEKYFELLKTRKKDEEESYLNQHPHLRFNPKRHEKCLMRATRSSLKYDFLIFCSYLFL